MISIDSNSDVSCYRRIIDAVRRDIASGTLVAGEKLPTQITLAKELGVNASTVRNAYEILENQGLVTSKIGSGTYVRSDARQQLDRSQGKRFGNITVVLNMPHLADCSRDMQRVGVDVLAGMEQVLQKQFDRFDFVEQSATASLKDLPDDSAVVIWQTCKMDPDAFDSLHKRGIPMVSVWADRGRLPIPHVFYDPHQAPALACQHLVECGYQRIGFIGDMGRSKLNLGAKFFEFTNVLFRSGLDFQVRHVREARQSQGQAYQAMLDIIKTGDLPEAFFVDTDDKALEVINALKKAGLKVPEDVGIVSYGDVHEAATFDPPLTTVRTPRREIGRQAARLLLEWDPQKPLPQDVTLTSELIIRNSTSSVRTADQGGMSTPDQASKERLTL